MSARTFFALGFLALAGAQFDTVMNAGAPTVDHAVNLTVTVTYVVKSPAFLTLRVTVPYITSTSTLPEVRDSAFAR